MARSRARGRRPSKAIAPSTSGAVGPGERFTLADATRRVAEGAARDARRISIEPDPRPEQLHRFHQRLRRLRAALRLVSALRTESQAEAAAETLRRLRRVARLVGEVRDFDVAIAHLSDPRLSASDRAPDERLESMLRRMREEARTGRALLGAFLRSEIDRGLFEDATTVLTSGVSRLEGRPAWKAARGALARGRARIERALKRARRRPDPDHMHRLRLELRRVHLLSDLLDDAVGREPPGFPSRLTTLQRALGTLHDLDLLVEAAEGLGHGADESGWIRREEERRRLLRKELIARFRKRSTRAAIAALAPD
jgi:CHAD domain-containing protein